MLMIGQIFFKFLDCSKINEYLAVKINNTKSLKYFGEISDAYDSKDFHALNFWIVTKEVVTTVNDLYDKELKEHSLFEYPPLTIFLRTSVKPEKNKS